MVEVLGKLQGVGGDERIGMRKKILRSLFLLIINEIPFDFL